MKKLLVFSSSLLLLYGVYFFTVGEYIERQRNKEFRLDNMFPEHPYNPNWEVHSVSLEEKSHIHSILNQKFRYVGFGNQIYTFFSEDNKYVLKFVKQRHYRVYRWIRYLIPPFISYRGKEIAHKQHNLDRDIYSYKIAFDQLQKETALHFVHLNPQDDFHHKITLVGPDHTEYNVDLHDFEFVLQDVADLVHPTIEKHMANGDIHLAKEGIDSLLEYLYQRCQKGISDSHPNFEKNFAFIDNKAVQIDVGRFSLKKPKHYPCIHKEFKEYLHAKFPELEAHFDVQYKAYTEKYASDQALAQIP
ncbi:MAG: hypothetical protein JSR58_05030 [Verrucomicrobia bacterium]|nr:hypothetical protein [Verrucomicrobiota bacterium]